MMKKPQITAWLGSVARLSGWYSSNGTNPNVVCESVMSHGDSNMCMQISRRSTYKIAGKQSTNPSTPQDPLSYVSLIKTIT